MTGTIKSVNKEKSFGFIKGEDGQEYFFHRSAIKNADFDDIGRGRDVTFEEHEGDKGLRAEDVYL